MFTAVILPPWDSVSYSVHLGTDELSKTFIVLMLFGSLKGSLRSFGG